MSQDKTWTDTGNRKTNLTEFTVSEISASLKKTVEEQFGHVRIRGEITGYRGPHSSGHCYFALKDDRARIEAVIWRGVFSKLAHKPEDGLEVIATGKLTTYPGSSKYQIVIENIEPAGAGALMALLAERKKKLEAEGLFAPERKQLLPYIPRHIGVITSPTGAVIRDILHRITDRFPLKVTVWPVRVQGETTGTEVSNAIAGFNAMGEDIRPDLLIVARGGGSIEDLWGFNDEVVVRAASDSHIPLISAVGHETDWTLIDLAADVRAPTPTGAAELAVPVRAELEATLASHKARLQSALGRQLEKARTGLLAAGRGLATPDSLLAMPRRRLDEATGRLGRGLDLATRAKVGAYERVAARLSARSLGLAIRQLSGTLENLQARLVRELNGNVQAHKATFQACASRLAHVPLAKQIAISGERLETLSRRQATSWENSCYRHNARIVQAERMLASLSYKAVLKRGYAVVRDADNWPVSTASAIGPGSPISIEFQDGKMDAIAASKTSAKPPRTKKNPDTSKSSQGDLF